MDTRTKICTACSRDLPLSQFHRKRDASDGRRSRCKDCRSRRGTVRKPKIAGATSKAVYARQWRAMHPDRDRCTERRARLKRKYGITPKDYEQMLAAQNGVCAICLQAETATHNGQQKRLAIDHDHATGHVRGLLCCSCNHAIGKAHDSPALLRKMAAYIDRSRDAAGTGPAAV